MKVLLLGARGMLGTDLAATAPSGVELHARDRRTLDVTNPAAVARTLDLVRPDTVINATGFTAVDRAETARDEAFAVNATAVSVLARFCAARNVRVVHFSTDYVFDGSAMHAYQEDVPTAPLSVYGESKLAAENALQESGAQFLILRTQWLFGLRGRSFPRTMWERACRGQPTRVVTDQTGRPTYTVDLARVTWRAIAAQLTGVFHAANGGQATRYEVAKRVFEVAATPELLSPCTSDNISRSAKRPAYSVLDTAKLERSLRLTIPQWTEALSEFLGQLRATVTPLPTRC
jgi:dTDP-4-dehydrorhamnose reductase